jgi:hypothetical protein
LHLQNREKFEQQGTIPRQLRKIESFPGKEASVSKTKSWQQNVIRALGPKLQLGKLNTSGKLSISEIGN